MQPPHVHVLLQCICIQEGPEPAEADKDDASEGKEGTSCILKEALAKFLGGPVAAVRSWFRRRVRILGAQAAHIRDRDAFQVGEPSRAAPAQQRGLSTGRHQEAPSSSWLNLENSAAKAKLVHCSAKGKSRSGITTTRRLLKQTVLRSS